MEVKKTKLSTLVYTTGLFYFLGLLGLIEFYKKFFHKEL